MHIGTITTLLNALRNIRTIKAKLAQYPNLTEQVFSTSELDGTLDDARARIGLEFMSLVQNARAVKPNDPVLRTFPQIHHNLKDHIARRNWLIREYGTDTPIKWGDVGCSVYRDVPTIETAILGALNNAGIPFP